MGFHKRYISNEIIQELFHTHGIKSIKELYSADAFVSEVGIASDITDAVLSNKHTTESWDRVTEMIEESVNKKK
tara:strand:- start:292 stop:513 length:222 start_codon:yes stop_codon:yes gene_type:complete